MGAYLVHEIMWLKIHGRMTIFMKSKNLHVKSVDRLCCSNYQKIYESAMIRKDEYVAYKKIENDISITRLKNEQERRYGQLKSLNTLYIIKKYFFSWQAKEQKAFLFNS